MHHRRKICHWEVHFKAGFVRSVLTCEIMSILSDCKPKPTRLWVHGSLGRFASFLPFDAWSTFVQQKRRESTEQRTSRERSQHFFSTEHITESSWHLSPSLQTSYMKLKVKIVSYFTAESENDNLQARRFAVRLLILKKIVWHVISNFSTHLSFFPTDGTIRNRPLFTLGGLRP
jgi:hypothetical protein